MMRNISTVISIALALSVAALTGSGWAAAPTGFVDLVSPTYAGGWAKDLDAPGYQVYVDLYSDDWPVAGRFLGREFADDYRADLGGNWAYNYFLPSILNDGYSHSISVYALDSPSGTPFHLPTSESGNRVFVGQRSRVAFCPMTMMDNPRFSGTNWTKQIHKLIGSHEDEWKYAQQNISHYQFFMGSSLDCTAAEFAELIGILKRNNIKIGQECGGLLDWHYDEGDPAGSQAGEVSAASEIAWVNDWLIANGAETLDYVVFDHPIERILYPWTDLQENSDTHGQSGVVCQNLETAINELIDSMEAWREAFPNIKFYYGVNFGWWGWKGGYSYFNVDLNCKNFFPNLQGTESYYTHGDFYELLQQVVRKTNEAGIPFYGVAVDQPYDYYIGEGATMAGYEQIAHGIDWKTRQLDIERYVDSMGMSFWLMVNSCRGSLYLPPDWLLGSNQRSHDESLAYIDDYHAIGGTPDVYMLENWNTHPDVYAPETTEYTFTNQIVDAVGKLDALGYAPRPVPYVDFQFNGSAAEGWVNTNDLSALSVANKRLSTSSDDGNPNNNPDDDPCMNGPTVSFQAADVDVIRIRMSVTGTGSVGEIFWRRSTDQFFDAGRRKGFTIISDGNMHTYDVVMDGTQYWDGQIVQLRLDPTHVHGSSIVIEYIQSSYLPESDDPPTAPSNLSAQTVSSSQIDLNWTDNTASTPDEMGFRIERSTNGTNYVAIASVAAQATEYSDTTVADQTAYWYRVCAYNDYDVSTYSNADSTTACDPPVAAFTANPTSGYFLTSGSPSSLAVTFTDQSTSGGAPTSWTWNFGDGSAESHAQHPVHYYTVRGTFTVTLTVANDAGADPEVKTDHVVVSQGWYAPWDFASTQGANNWSYFTQSPFGMMTYNQSWWQSGTYPNCRIAANSQTPSGAICSRGWQCPQTGTVRVMDWLHKAQSGGNGVYVAVYVAGGLRWFQQILGNDTNAYTYDISVENVQAGSWVEFQVYDAGDDQYDNLFTTPAIFLTCD